MKTLSDVASALRGAHRIGSEKDEPEGSRYIQISETLANQILGVLENEGFLDIPGLDCQDNSCRYRGKVKGRMGTNGGCRCVEQHPREVERGLLRKIHILQRDNEQLRAELERVAK